MPQDDSQLSLGAPGDERYSRMKNGVKRRVDGAGDGWARQHRELGRGYQMQDVDAQFGMHVFGANTGDRLFVEYAPDDYANRTNVIRRFAYVAMFDRKSTKDAAFCDANRVSQAFYLDMCRRLGDGQPRLPRFFYVIGTAGPWLMVEININTGEPTGDEAVVSSGAFKEVWDRLGLAVLRNELTSWIESES